MSDTMTVAELKIFQETGKLPKRHQKKTRMEVIEAVAAQDQALAEQAADAVKKRNKYGAVKTEHNGIKFDSIKEGKRYLELKAFEEAGAISNLQVHPKYTFKHNDIHIGTYTPDFQYWEDGKLVVEDVKSSATKTRDYVLRKKMMAAFHNIDVKEV